MDRRIMKGKVSLQLCYIIEQSVGSRLKLSNMQQAAVRQGVEVGNGRAYQMKSVQWLQKVGCLKNLAMNLWFLTSWTFFCLRAPFRANLFATSAEDDSFKLTSAMSP